MSTSLSCNDQVPLLVATISMDDSTTMVAPATPTIDVHRTATSSSPPRIGITKRPKIRGAMVNMLRRHCRIRNVHGSECTVRPKQSYMYFEEEDDDDEDTALLTESSSRTNNSMDEDDIEVDTLLR